MKGVCVEAVGRPGAAEGPLPHALAHEDASSVEGASVGARGGAWEGQGEGRRGVDPTLTSKCGDLEP